MKRYNRKSRELGAAHAVLVFVVVLVLVGVLGFVGYNAWQRKVSNAGDTGSVGTNTAYVFHVVTAEGCNLAGRVWSNGNCTAQCHNGTYKKVTLKSGSTGYCTGSIDTAIGASSCKGYERKFVNNLGCAKLSVFQDKFSGSGRGYAIDAKQCLAGYRDYFQNTNDFCTKGVAGVSATRDRTKPSVLTATTTMKLSGQFESIDPRTGYSFSQQATYWTKSRAIADGLYMAKHDAGTYSMPGTFGKVVTKNNWKEAEAFLKKQTNGNMYGVWRWTNEDSSDNLFNTYNASKPFKKINTASFTYNEAECQRSIAQYGYCDYSPSFGYNPNYFSSAADQAAWVKKYNVSVTPTTYNYGKTATIVTGWGHTYASEYKFKYADGMSPGFGSSVLPSATKGTSPFRLNAPLN